MWNIEESANILLNYAISQGIINLDDVRNSMKEKEKQRLLSKHKYKIFQGKDGRWRTTLPDEGKKDGRKLIVKKSYESLVKVIIEYYAMQEDNNINKEYFNTLRKIYLKWIAYKEKHTESSAYIKRIHVDWNKYYKNNEIADIPLFNLTYLYIDSWIHDTIKKYQLTKKQYYNMSIILRQCLDFAMMDGMDIIDTNPMQRVKVSSKLFSKKPLPDRETQVFLEDEQRKIADECLERYNKRPDCTTALAIMLNFQIGLRAGELMTLKWSDIRSDYLYISRMEVSRFNIEETDSEISTKRTGFEVVDYTKTQAGERKIYLNHEAKKILSLIKSTNEKYCYYDNDYIFISSQTKRRSNSATLSKYLWKVCDSLSISTKKGNHKIRKTYISSLFDKGVNIDTIRSMAGHEDERRSLHNYCFNQKDDRELKKQLENAKNTNVIIKCNQM